MAEGVAAGGGLLPGLEAEVVGLAGTAAHLGLAGHAEAPALLDRLRHHRGRHPACRGGAGLFLPVLHPHPGLEVDRLLVGRVGAGLGQGHGQAGAGHDGQAAGVDRRRLAGGEAQGHHLGLGVGAGAVVAHPQHRHLPAKQVGRRVAQEGPVDGAVGRLALGVHAVPAARDVAATEARTTCWAKILASLDVRLSRSIIEQLAPGLLVDSRFAPHPSGHLSPCRARNPKWAGHHDDRHNG